MWAITINTGYGVTDKDKANLLKFFNKQPRAFLITEKTDDKQHYHGGIMFDREVIQGNVRNQLLRLFPDFDENQKKRAIIIKNWYNIDWYANYCDKDEHTDILMDTFKPEDSEILPFPDPDDKQDARPVNPWFDKMEKLWQERHPNTEATEKPLLQMLNSLMYKERKIEIITDPKKYKDKVRCLIKYINKDDHPSYTNPHINLDENTLIDRVEFCTTCCKKRKTGSSYHLA